MVNEFDNYFFSLLQRVLHLPDDEWTWLEFPLCHRLSADPDVNKQIKTNKTCNFTPYYNTETELFEFVISPVQTSIGLRVEPFQGHHECNRIECHCIAVHSYQSAVQRIPSMDSYQKWVRIHRPMLPNSISLAVHSSTFGMLVEFYRPFHAYRCTVWMLSVTENPQSIVHPCCNRFVPVAC